MASVFSPEIWGIIACPGCSEALEDLDHCAFCNYCNTKYNYSNLGSLDLRLKYPKKYYLEFELPTPLLPESGFEFKPLWLNPSAEVDFSKTRVPNHLTRALLSYFPRAQGRESFMLDLGCGSQIHREVCESAGFQYVGLDYKDSGAAILGDAHSIPFKNDSFEFVLSVAVFEHIRFPFVMIREAFRVLKREGKLIGTVAFLEPFHGNSFYHHSHLGIFSLLQYGGFEIERIAPSNRWTALRALAYMGLFPRIPKFLSMALLFPIESLHKIWWSVGALLNRNVNKHDLIRNNTGSFSFVATKKFVCN